jgi:hypothetical protein
MLTASFTAHTWQQAQHHFTLMYNGLSTHLPVMKDGMQMQSKLLSAGS